MLNRMFEVLKVHSYYGTIVPHDKSETIEQILEFAVKEHHLNRTYLLVMLPKLQLQVEHFGKMAATSGCIKVVEKCIE